MNGIIFCGGKTPCKSVLDSVISNDDFIIGADSGFDIAHKNGYTPSRYIGDLDSTNEKALIENMAAANKDIYSVDKDFTDTELAISFLQKKAVDRIILIGGGPGSTMHFLGLLTVFHRDVYPNVWYTDAAVMYVIDKHFIFSGMEDTKVSFIPLGTSAVSCTTHGLKWELTNLTFSRGSASISNRIIQHEFSILPEKGRLLMIVDIDERGAAWKHHH